MIKAGMLGLLAALWWVTPVCAREYSLGDANGDGFVNGFDFRAVRDNFGRAYPTPTPDPELEIITLDLPNLPPGARPLRMVRIPAGSFQMGSPPDERGRSDFEGPVHTVNLGYSFYMSETEITQGQWQAVVGHNPAAGWGEGEDYPVYDLSWYMCQDFIMALNQLGQGTFRLPSEAEWEYACRAGTDTRFAFGYALECNDECGACALSDRYMWWCGNNIPDQSKPVASKLPNPWGLYDMHGNVWEWCEDDWHDRYQGAPTDGRAWSDTPRGSSRVLRSGDWYLNARLCRSAARIWYAPATRIKYFGVRLIRNAP